MMTKSLEDYIEMIYVLIRGSGVARVRDVAESLDVKMPSVVKAIMELKKLELVTQEPYGGIELTEKGRRCALHVLNRHTTLKAFLMTLKVSERIADKDACLMEHILSAETMDRIHDFLEIHASPKVEFGKVVVQKKTTSRMINGKKDDKKEIK